VALALPVVVSLVACKPEPARHSRTRTIPAGLAPPVSSDIDKFVNRRAQCEHFRGEVSYDRTRGTFLNRKISETCLGTDAELAGLRRKYRDDKNIIRQLFIYDDKVERPRDIKAVQRLGLEHDLAHGPWHSETAQGRAILAALERGEPRALASYSRLHNTANVEWTEDVDYSVAMALTHDPEGVLAMADTPERFDSFCTSPLIEPEPGVERAFLRDAVKALRAIGNASPMAARRDACVKRLSGMMGG